MVKNLGICCLLVATTCQFADADDTKPDRKPKTVEAAVNISVVFPAYNEEGNIHRTVTQAREFLEALTPHWEIIVVNDGSADRTGEICAELSEVPK